MCDQLKDMVVEALGIEDLDDFIENFPMPDSDVVDLEDLPMLW